MPKPTDCTNPRHDHYAPISSLEDFGRTWDPADVVTVAGDEVVPMLCADCDEPTFYDLDLESYRHVSRGLACFLIPPGLRYPSACEYPAEDGPRLDPESGLWLVDGLGGEDGAAFDTEAEAIAYHRELANRDAAERADEIGSDEVRRAEVAR